MRWCGLSSRASLSGTSEARAREDTRDARGARYSKKDTESAVQATSRQRLSFPLAELSRSRRTPVLARHAPMKTNEVSYFGTEFSFRISERPRHRVRRRLVERRRRSLHLIGRINRINIVRNKTNKMSRGQC